MRNFTENAVSSKTNIILPQNVDPPPSSGRFENSTLEGKRILI